MPEELRDDGPVASDSGVPLPAEVGMVELVQAAPALHEELKANVGKHVILHVWPGFAVQGTLRTYDEDRGVCTVIDRDTNYVAAGSIGVMQVRGTADV